MDIVDVVVHLDESIEGGEQHRLEELLRQLDGVIAPRFNAQHRHLLVVAYNPARLDARRVLQGVKDAGFAARLVGM